MKIINTFLLSIIFYSNFASACYTIPKNLARPATEVIKDAKQIYWVQVIGALPQHVNNKWDGELHVKYILKVIETLKGIKHTKNVMLNGIADVESYSTSIHDNHKDINDQFKYGSTGLSSGCLPIPALLVGGQYVIFMGGPPDTKDFERVESDEDEWLQFIRFELN